MGGTGPLAIDHFVEVVGIPDIGRFQPCASAFVCMHASVRVLLKTI
jgi:hypothetical protein